mmetsp:Transcript_7372/g.33306  ORF Transcript_7372/g.33306 Transcript_7372/m.33306 type:complete len:264 (+) Transcript_7372:210-1001(+)
MSIRQSLITNGSASLSSTGSSSPTMSFALRCSPTFSTTNSTKLGSSSPSSSATFLLTHRCTLSDRLDASYVLQSTSYLNSFFFSVGMLSMRDPRAFSSLSAWFFLAMTAAARFAAAAAAAAGSSSSSSAIVVAGAAAAASSSAVYSMGTSAFVGFCSSSSTANTDSLRLPPAGCFFPAFLANNGAVLATSGDASGDPGWSPRAFASSAAAAASSASARSRVSASCAASAASSAALAASAAALAASAAFRIFSSSSKAASRSSF